MPARRWDGLPIVEGAPRKPHEGDYPQILADYWLGREGRDAWRVALLLTREIRFSMAWEEKEQA